MRLFTQVVKGEYGSYKDCRVIVSHIQNKYRDEARPPAGILRGREFLIKDSCSFDVSDDGLAESYRLRVGHRGLPRAPRRAGRR